LAGCGHAKDGKGLADAARAKLREQTRNWLRDELGAWTKLVESGTPDARPVVVRNLKHWREDADLDGVRETERAGWRTLWAGVEALLIKAQAAPAPVGQ
jgi:hypothetical protein